MSVVPCMEVQTMIKSIRVALRQKICFVMVVLLMFIVVVSQVVPWNPSPAYAAAPPALAGRVVDSQGEPVHGAKVGVREKKWIMRFSSSDVPATTKLRKRSPNC